MWACTGDGGAQCPAVGTMALSKLRAKLKKQKEEQIKGPERGRAGVSKANLMERRAEVAQGRSDVTLATSPPLAAVTIAREGGLTGTRANSVSKVVSNKRSSRVRAVFGTGEGSNSESDQDGDEPDVNAVLPTWPVRWMPCLRTQRTPCRW